MRSKGRRSSERGRRLPLAPKRDEWEGIIDGADTDRDQPLLGTRDAAIASLLCFSGIRNFELCALDISDVARWDRETGWELTGIAHIRHGKGDKERFAPIADEGLDLLEAYLDVRPDPREGFKTLLLGVLFGEPHPDRDRLLLLILDVWISFGDPLFVSRKERGRLTTKAIRDLVKAAGGKAGFGRKLHPHALRHANATARIEKLNNGGKGTVYDVAADLGHASLDTLSLYTHLAAAGRRERMRDL